ncbi:rho GTPase-activating protein 27 isoform X1 [Anarrhichthys ocellatus]|uniref:rho GTPase-activating protein 27 isoform X1 n=1 Tax=Anarrhichthys ocellatus TaxID=433405 RepID=UPI0012ED5623|nr:rho GTPase-activating protein 27-like isoform X1 [Anarrhichthys ocellatus]
MELVSVLHGFEYTAKDGRLVSIKPDESYVLVSKTNEHWWHVRRDQHTRPFYVPAQYVKALSEDSPGPNKVDSPECVTHIKPEDTANITPVIRVSAPDASRETHRFSTFGFCENIPDVRPCENIPDVRPCENPEEEPTTSSFAHNQDNIQTHSSAEGFSLTSGQVNADGLQLYAKSHPVPKVQNGQRQPDNSPQDEKVEQPQTFLLDEDVDFSSPPNSPIYDTIPVLNFPECSELPGPVASDDTLMIEQQNLNQYEEVTPPTDEDPIDQVENESLRSAVYVNVAQLRQSISESPPSAPSSYSPSYLDPEGWEAHVDRDSGQEYYYHPSTGRTTWDNPFLDSPTDPEPPCSPSPPQSPALSPAVASPPAWISDWEQLVDETSGRPYFYNAMSGKTSWEHPEQLSPYPALMEPMSVHRFHEDGLPPLPNEDYPSQEYSAADQPEGYEDPLPKEYTLSHVSQTIIPRANLDRSTPAGWNLSVEPNGTWVFTNEHSPEQWIKSVDDRGQTYYYLRDGSRSQWTLPQVPVAAGQFRMENGVEAGNLSVIKNWRHTMGPGQLSLAQDEGRFVPTHRRKTSDYSSDSSSTGNSPETQHNAFGFRPWRNPYYLTSRWLRYNVQNLEKAGILNKTKVCENGKKVRKNWAQTWTVLHGGVLTFHKDPKSAVTGTLHKTNQIVPEVTVDLRGASIGRASKDKSSKKNVLELKGKNGVEFLIQYDTESIITDWHKVLMDTIRQLEYLDHHSEDEDGDIYEKIVERDDKVAGGIDKQRSSRLSITHSSSSAGETDQKRIRTKLMKFLMKRPTLQSVKEKGYIRDNVFGCHLATLCAQEKTTVPSFVEKCIKAVETRGLDIDGLYRVSGNLAVIQKLRFKADHEELDLEDGQWEDVHVITGALKLFFRELPEPLFPFSHFNKFITAIRIPDYKTKVSCMYELVNSLPPSNHDTIKLLFGHLRRVIQYGEDNRMTVQNVAIVFGPTLLRPETEASNIAMHMVFQNQIVELVLNEYERIFFSS